MAESKKLETVTRRYDDGSAIVLVPSITRAGASGEPECLYAAKGRIGYGVRWVIEHLTQPAQAGDGEAELRLLREKEYNV